MHSSLLPLAVCLGVAFAAPKDNRGDDHTSRAIYTLSNNPNGSKILAWALSPEDGKVSKPSLTSTGGKGEVGLNIGQPFGAPGSNAGPDGLFDQGAVKVSQNYLFTVNPGSNTLSLFSINPRDPLHPKLIGRPADTQGEFPVSVDFSPKLQTACVLNGGAKAGVACFSVSPHQGLRPLGSLRPLQDLKQKTPPSGPPGTGSDIVFNRDSTAVFVTIKGSPGPPAAPGFIYAFPVSSHGDMNTTPVISQIKDVILDFSLNFLGSSNRALITDPSFGAAIVSISSDLKVSETHHVTIANQGAACWGAYSQRFDSAYVIDAGHPNITVVDPASGTIKGRIGYDATAKGGFDSAIDRQWMYLLTADDSVVVLQLDRNGGKQVQKQGLHAYGPDKYWQGMAAWPAEQ